MSLINSFAFILLLTIYWSSYIAIGLSVYLLTIKKFRALSLRVSTIENYNIAFLFVFFCIGLLTMVPAVLISYMLELKIEYILISYTIVFFTSIIVIVLNINEVKRIGLLIIRKINKDKYLKFLVISFFAIGIILSLLGSSLGGDSLVHIAKINSLVGRGMSLDDPFFGVVDESRYHFSLIHALYTIPIRSIGILTFNSWYYSVSFFGVLYFISIYLLTTLLVVNNFLKKYNSLITIFTIAISVSLTGLISMNYPSTLALSFIVLGIVGLWRFGSKYGPALLTLASILIALTHPTYSLGFLLYILLFTTIICIYYKTRLPYKAFLPIIIINIIILALPVLFTAHYVRIISDQTYNFGNYMLIDIFNMEIMKPTITIKRIILFVLSLFGVYLIYKRNPVYNKILIITITLFFSLIAYNPLVFETINNIVPTWLINRFSNINRIALILPVIGLFYLYFKLSRMNTRIGSIEYLIISIPIIMSAANAIELKNEAFAYNEYNSSLNIRKVYNDINNVSETIEGARVLATPSTSFILPAFANSYVLAIDANNATPTADSISRLACQEKYLKLLDSSDIGDADIGYVVLGTWEEPYYSTAKDSKYLRAVDQSGPIVVYEIISESMHILDNQCIFINS